MILVNKKELCHLLRKKHKTVRFFTHDAGQLVKSSNAAEITSPDIFFQQFLNTVYEFIGLVGPLQPRILTATDDIIQSLGRHTQIISKDVDLVTDGEGGYGA